MLTARGVDDFLSIDGLRGNVFLPPPITCPRYRSHWILNWGSDLPCDGGKADSSGRLRMDYADPCVSVLLSSTKICSIV